MFLGVSPRLLVERRVFGGEVDMATFGVEPLGRFVGVSFGIVG